MIISGYVFNLVLFKENFNYKKKNIYLILSFIFFSNIFLIVNFFLPLNLLVNTLIFLIPLVFIKNIKILDIKKILIYSLKFAIFFALLVGYDNINRPDAGLYHFPYMSTLNSEKIIFGSANIHFRYAHVSIIQYLSAGFNNILFFDKGLLIPPALIFFCVSNFFYNEIKKQQNNNLLLFVSFFILFQILYDMNRYSGYGNDVPAHILFLICTYLFVKYDLNDYRSFFIISALCILIFQSKSTLIIILILPILIIILNKNLEFIYKKKNIILICFITAWFIKNIIISGCMLFPKEITCSKKIFWSSSLVTNMNSADKVSLENEARSKDHPSRINRDMNYQEYLNSNWRPIWIKGHGKIVILKKIIPLIILLTCLSIFIFFSKKKYSRYKQDKSRFFLIFFLTLIGSIVWFENFPTYRYGSAYLIGVIIFSFACLFLNEKVKLKNYLKIKYLNFLIAIILVKFVLKYDNSKNLWPNIYNYNSNNLNPPKVIKVFINNNFAYYKTVNGDICMYNLSPCTHFDLEKEISFKIINGYKFFYLVL
tara:strand:+ start:302 stop:1918 length:1617 start_codon:yes stop_codon:yes gene_type:complete